jgi:hypothetical protein
MGYPQGVATGNVVIAAAVELHQREMSGRPTRGAYVRLNQAVAAHLEATAVAHVQGPDMDARS